MMVKTQANSMPNIDSISSHLHRAIVCFEDSLEIDPNNLNSIINLAVTKAKLARISKGSEKMKMFEQSCRHYKIAIDKEPNHKLYFDYANNLYRYAREKMGVEKGTREATELLKKSCFCYGKSLEMKPTVESWTNFAIVIEKLSSMKDELDSEFLVPFLEQFFQFEYYDPKKAERLRSKISGAANDRVRRMSFSSESPVSPNHSAFKDSDEFLNLSQDSEYTLLYSMIRGLREGDLFKNMQFVNDNQCRVFGELKYLQKMESMNSKWKEYLR